MANYTLDLPGIPDGSAGDFPHVADALEQIATKAHELWLAYAGGAPLPNGQTVKARSGGYMASIKLRPMGGMAWEVYSDAPYASAIERGAPAYDMKSSLGSAPKARVAKNGPHKGQKYLIIPFRHGNPDANYGAMPLAIHARAKTLSPSHVTGSFFESSVNRPEGVRRFRYSWGDRLEAGLAPKLKPHHKTDIYAGMVKMANPGNSRHNSYMTFRIMGEWSSGWLRPAQVGKYPLRAVKEQIEPIAQRTIQAAIEMDLARQVARIEGAFR